MPFITSTLQQEQAQKIWFWCKKDNADCAKAV